MVLVLGDGGLSVNPDLPFEIMIIYCKFVTVNITP
jgi:hypothetical protein